MSPGAPEKAGWDGVDTLTLAGGEVVILTRRSPTSDGENEDAAAAVGGAPGNALLAVADGFGGAPAGERASRLAIEEMAARAVESRADGASLRASILDGFESANKRILDLGIGAATTLAAVAIEGRTDRKSVV